MPRYYFHLYNDFNVTDREGREIADIAAARRAAEQDAREMAALSVRDGRLDLAHYVEVTDKSGEPVLRIKFGDAVAVVDGAAGGRAAKLPNLDQ